MRRWNVDFVDQPRPPVVAWVALLAAALLLGDALWQARALRAQAAQLELAAAAPDAKAAAPEARDPLADRERVQTEVVARRLSLPWDELFRAIESASAQRVALLSIDPDAQSGRLTITGEAVDQRAVIAYLTRLSRLPQLRQVHLVQHEVPEDAPQVVRFVVAAHWRALP